MASGGGKAKASSWAAAMSVGTVEALKDQAGLCRWNYAFRTLQQRGRQQAVAGTSGAKSGGGARALQPAAAAAARRKAQQQEEELRTVMYLSNWGPNN
ncbi:uncharacterized protein [Oryza sativa Japonica Group]|mgnify:CR=1 FL=1|jgi:hypothetical protein|uniref:OSJNBa0043L09.18 protein n=7 Tax=Oryza TaxID=4527 RepID=A3AXS3_ORYSJ|nr:uncharacterized protein LOC4337129 [Oryza sativa Japonica Group]EAY99366.1 hypothetical protein OsI_21336 [Oryza sativa Indica Group]KAB8097122.1 hypothetical protein EE612_025776 [Oryza sativa]EAZ32112.1 hypothetical protein OsJ_16307 [Oryza sativa Japonica Group]KAF2936063.1 hypothetical protein DAI22_04g276450 [Oryza sativa Japonica Group]CAE02999.2 OSJNBa0043L09.18 [Oryza sativa Japonica Group]|eukprot:NP_001054004.1 Os04g0635000 [Oryza sativa Japonica Group]